MKVLFIKEDDVPKFEGLLSMVASYETATSNSVKDAAKLLKTALETKVKTKVIYKSSESGRIVTKEFALDNRETTYRTVVLINK